MLAVENQFTWELIHMQFENCTLEILNRRVSVNVSKTKYREHKGQYGSVVNELVVKQHLCNFQITSGEMFLHCFPALVDEEERITLWLSTLWSSWLPTWIQVLFSLCHHWNHYSWCPSFLYFIHWSFPPSSFLKENSSNKEGCRSKEDSSQNACSCCHATAAWGKESSLTGYWNISFLLQGIQMNIQEWFVCESVYMILDRIENGVKIKFQIVPFPSF